MAGIRQTAFYNLKNKVGGWQLIIIIIIIISSFYFSFSTRWIPTLTKINRTDANNNTIELDAIYSYAFERYIPKETQFENANTQIPKSSYEPEGALLIIFLVVVLVVLYTKKDRGERLLIREEIEEKAKIYLKNMKDVEHKLSDYKILMGAKLSEKQVDSGQRLPNWWYIAVDVTTIEDDPEHRLLGFHPFGDGHLVFDLKLDREFTDRDVCSRCGMFYDMHIISPTGYKDWFEKFSVKRQ